MILLTFCAPARTGIDELSKPDDALADFSKAIELNLKLLGPYVSRVNLNNARSDMERVLADYGVIIQLVPADPAAYEARFQSLRKGG